MDHVKLDPPHDIGFWEYSQHDRSHLRRAIGWGTAVLAGGAMLYAFGVFAGRFIEALGRWL